MKASIKFLPLLLLYIFVILTNSGDLLVGDEGRYILFANNLSHGYYSPRDDVYLWNGPGYPLILLLFILLKLPWLAAKLLNAAFLFAAILYFYRALSLYVADRPAIILSYILGLYPTFLSYAHHLLTETLSVFLVCGFLFHFCALHRNRRTSWKHLLISGAYLAYLALTKIFFGYVIFVGLVIFLALLFFLKTTTLRRTALVYLFALGCCVPYLFYTHSLTGKIFYWGNSGGVNLYWMSVQRPSLLGDWHSEKEVLENPELYEEQHELFVELEKLPSIQRDDELKKLAIRNIVRNPRSYLRNWVANVGRLLFNYPFSYTAQKLSTYFYVVPNMFIVVLSTLLIFPTYRGRKHIPHELFALLLFCLISAAGSSLIAGTYARQFALLVPIFLLWIVFVSMRVLRVEICNGYMSSRWSKTDQN